MPCVTLLQRDVARPPTLTPRISLARRKNKFCEVCRGRSRTGGVLIPASRVRGLPADLDDVVLNSPEGGVWSVAPAVLRDARYRVINNTAVRKRLLP